MTHLWRLWVLTASVLIVSVLSQSTARLRSCPGRCRSCGNQVAECSKRSLTAPPRRYPPRTRTINLQNNNIRVLGSRSFQRLESVEILKVSNNKITSIRNDAFRAFPNLITLDLVNNKIHNIQRQALRNMTRLRTLSLNRNRIRSLGRIFAGVPNLFQLNVARNRIRSINQNDLSQLTLVHYLDFRDNRITRIHSNAFSQLQNLRYLFLNNNPLAGPLTNLQFASQVLQLADLSHCHLTTVPRPFPSSVSDMRLGNNRLEQINYTDFTNITDLQMLALNDNQLRFLADGTLAHLHELEEVWLRGNRLGYIPRQLPDSVRKLHMDSNLLQEIEASGVFSPNSRLYFLTVESNEINRLHPNTFSGLRFLDTINFQGNQLQVLETDSFNELGSLSTLLLSSNPLTRIEFGAFKRLDNLTQLYLSHITAEDFELASGVSFLTEMPRLQILQLMNSPGLADDLMAFIANPEDSPFPSPTVTTLDLSFNNLAWISPRVRVVFPNLISMPLDGNPLRCSVNLRWLKEWMMGSQISLFNYQEPLCENPSRLRGKPIRDVQDNEWAAEDEPDYDVNVAYDQAVVSASQSGGAGLSLRSTAQGNEEDEAAKKRKEERRRRRKNKGRGRGRKRGRKDKDGKRVKKDRKGKKRSGRRRREDKMKKE